METTACNFPDAIQFGEAIALSRIITSGEIAQKRGLALQHAACFAGSLGFTLGGEGFGADPADVDEFNAYPDSLEDCAAMVLDGCVDGEPDCEGPYASISMMLLIRLLILAIPSIFGVDVEDADF